MNMLKHNKFGSLLKRSIKPLVFLFGLFILTGCNEEFPNLLKEEYPADFGSQASKNAKVLFVIVDGLQGETLKGLEPEEIPTISEMNKNAIYSFNSLADYNSTEMTDALGWTTLMTGVTSSKHGVITDFSVNNMDSYPTFISRIKVLKPEIRSVVFGRPDFVDNLAKDAKEKASFSTDVETKNAVKEELKKDDAGIVLAQFHEVSDALDGSDEDYIKAVVDLDKKLGELKSGLEARPNYRNENWIVIVTSNKGDDSNLTFTDKYDDASRNTFTMFYSPRFSSRIAPKPLEGIPYVGNAMRYKFGSSERNTATIKDVEAYNWGSKPKFTLQLTIKSEDGDYIYPTILSKRAVGFSGAGWNLFLEGKNWTLNSSIAGQVKGGLVSDGQWHTITVVFDGDNNKIIGYTDGVFNAEQTMNANSLNNDSPLKIGYLPTDGNQSANVLITNIQLFDRALSSSIVSAFACKTTVNEAHPNWNNLISYWPGDDVGKVTMKERTGKGHDFNLNGGLRWESFSDIAPKLCPDVKPEYFTMVPNSVDFAFQIYQWLGIPVPQTWSLDGKAWTPSYTQIRP